MKSEGNQYVKFVLETGLNILIHSYEIGKISITGINADHPELVSGTIDEWNADDHLGIIRKSVSIRTDGSIKRWQPETYSEFTPDNFIEFTQAAPEILLIGTGKMLRFPAQENLTVLQQNNLGYEVMDTAAACRTFNVLAAEGRDVILAILMIENE